MRTRRLYQINLQPQMTDCWERKEKVEREAGTSEKIHRVVAGR